MSGLLDRIRNIDGHSSASKEFRVYTAHGAVLSVVTVLAVLYLVSKEAYFNFQVITRETVHVNATTPAGLELEFDITLPSVPCRLLNIDANDPTGQQQSLHLDRRHHVWKHRIKMEHGRLLVGEKAKLELGSVLKEENLMEIVSSKKSKEKKKKKNAANGTDVNGTDADVEDDVEEEEDEEEGIFDDDDDDDDVSEDESSDECGSCFGAGEEGECCNTCDDVRRAYRLKGWILHDLASVKQCKREMDREQRSLSSSKAASSAASSSTSDSLASLLFSGVSAGNHTDTNHDADEGCNVHGKVALSTGGGNLHLAPGKDITSFDGGTSIFEILLSTFHKWNVSHTIHKIRFGPEYPAAVYQLDNQTRTITDSYGMYQYYIQVVPTLYRFRNGTTIQTNQYSVTEHLRHVSPGSSRGLPGVFIFYEVSPLHVEMYETYRKGWTAFFTSVCAVVGGVVTVMGMIDQMLFARSNRRLGDGAGGAGGGVLGR